MHRTIELPDEQVGQLEQLASSEHRSVDDIVRLAVGDYLARRQRDRADWC